MGPAVKLSLLLVASSVLVGCIGDNSPDEDLGGNAIDVGSSSPTVVHLAGGVIPDVLPPLPPALGGLFTMAHSAIEPTLGITASGAIFVAASGFGLADNGGPATDVLRSRDGGATWEIVTPEAPVVGGRAPPSTGDPYLYVDPVTDTVYNFDMWPGLACGYLSWSEDEGDTWTQRPAACGTPPPYDHQTLVAGASPVTAVHETVLYQCVNRISDSTCSRSFDGGLTWVAATPSFLGLDVTRVAPSADPFATVFSGLCGGLHGHIVSAPDGAVFLPRTYCGDPMVAISRDFGTTWQQVVVNELDSYDDPAMAVDADGNVYFLQLTPDGGLWLTISTDGGATWGAPLDVRSPNVDAALFPTIVAGDSGKIAFAYAGTENLPDGLLNDEFADGYDEEEDDEVNAANWNGYIAVVTNALDAQPVIQTTMVNDPGKPLIRGHCGPFRCPGMYDFIDIVLSPEGRPYAAFVDACIETCDTAKGTHEDTLPIGDPGYVGVLGTLVSGPALIGEGELPTITAPPQ